MRIIINDIAASTGGAISVLKEFYNYIVENDKENEWIFLLSEKYIEETQNIKVILRKDVKESWIRRLLFDFFYGRKFINSLNPDVILYLQNTIIHGLKIPQVMYMDQALPFQKIKRFSFFKRSEFKMAIYQHLIGYLVKKGVKKADKIIVQTEWLKESIINQTKIKPQKIIKAVPTMPNLNNYKVSSKFDNTKFFYPASDEIYKNHKCIYKACKLLKDKGVNNFEVDITLNDYKSYENIKCIGHMPYNNVIDKYNYSTLIFPSYIESFGLPLAEAREMGTIILASKCDFCIEILKDYKNAYFFNPFEPKELAELMQKVIKGKIMKLKVGDESIKVNNGWETIYNTIIKLKK